MSEIPAADAAAAPLGYAVAPTRLRAGMLRWVRAGTPGFLLLVSLLAGAAVWGTWKLRLYRDRSAFDACASTFGNGTISFTGPPSRGVLRHLARLPGGPWDITLDWAAAEGPGRWAGIGAVKLRTIAVGRKVGADAVLAELARPDYGAKSLIFLGLWDTNATDAGMRSLARPDSGLGALRQVYLTRVHVTDAGLAALARPDSGLKSLTGLYLASTDVTDAGLAELARTDCGLKALDDLSLWETNVTDAGLATLARPDAGLRSLTHLDLRFTHVTEAGIKALKKSRPALQVDH